MRTPPPQHRPGPFLAGPGGMLIGTDDGGVARDDPVGTTVGVGLGEQGGEHALPSASAARFRSRMWAPFHEPKCSGRSIRGVPVRYLNAIASITCR